MTSSSRPHCATQLPQRAQAVVDRPDCLIERPKTFLTDHLAAEIPHDSVAVALRIQNAITAAVYGPRSRR